MAESVSTTRADGALGTYLANVRQSRNLSQRQVEILTHKAVSNAYLSQIENGKIGQPSPNILHALANAYSVSYEQLMEMAGFISGTREAGAIHGRATTFADMELTPVEEEELLNFLHFRRAQAKKKPKHEGG